MLKLATKFAPHAAAFERAYCAGYRATELWLDAALLADWRRIARLGRHYPFEYVLHFPNESPLPREALAQTIGLYRELGCRTLVIHQQQFDQYSAALLAIEPLLQLAIENHVFPLAGFEQWATHSPGLTLDVEHLWKFTLNDAPFDELLATLRGFLSRCASKLRHVHLPGYFPGSPEHRPMYCSREMVFEVFSLLQTHAFTGLIVSEIEPEYQNANDMRMDALLFDTWRALKDPVLKSG